MPESHLLLYARKHDAESGSLSGLLDTSIDN